MNSLNYHHLLYFKTIALEGSISKASQKLLVGQPALSAQLKQLEEYFGQQLFERRNRQLVLNDAGKVALKYASEIYSLGIELQQVLKDKSLTTFPHLNIGVLDSIPKTLILKLVKFAQQENQCQITILNGSNQTLYQQLMAHTIDLFISNHHIMSATDKSTYIKSIGSSAIGVYAAKKFRALKKDFPYSLNNQPLILPTIHSKLRNDIDHYLEIKKIYCKVVADSQDTTIQKFLACEGIGIIVEPDFSVQELINEKKLIKLGAFENIFEEFFLISTNRFVKNLLINRVFADFSL